MKARAAPTSRTKKWGSLAARASKNEWLQREVGGREREGGQERERERAEAARAEPPATRPAVVGSALTLETGGGGGEKIETREMKGDWGGGGSS